MSKDIGNKCIKCFEDTSFGSGKFVDRIPAEDDEHDGYMCWDCYYCPELDDDTEEFLNYEVNKGVVK